VNMPEIRLLQPGDEAALEAFLRPHVESSMFLIGNMRSAGLVDHGQPYQGTYAAAFDGGQIVGVVAHYWNRVLVFQSPDHLDALWRKAVAVSKRPVEGLIGPDDQVGAVMAKLDIKRSSVQVDEASKLYSLDLGHMAILDALTSGAVRGRRIQPRDVDLVTEWRVAYNIELLGETDGPQLREECRAGIQRSLEEGRTWVLECQRQLVSCSSFNTAIKEAVQVGGVYTPPELRRRGYGRAVVAASLLDARAEGAEKAILFTGVDNIAAQRAYEALGFRHIDNYRMVLLRSPLRASQQNVNGS
jgi:ribosomal protein S18 acetylase RimI-like enzyme